MLDILVTVGVILVLIALAALLLHLINTHRDRSIATARYEDFHPGNPPRSPGDREESTGRGAPREQQDREGPERGGDGPPPRAE
ncbi:hypothetical protein [Streptomyces sp. WMMB 322]|uniref:hypothetical protein n=1 Tax=Streptomyces sp. WMMB 322 TaxID=1286821 RepID=UPI0006E166F7|nr:hypothetical protein [Streptomyces sp. WMMB 322]SCK38063.1 hypothetical protein H180DRAFT_03214 [Streptomyces sp. WMMB 322]